AAAPAAPVAEAAPAPAAAQAAPGSQRTPLPRVTPFELPTASLEGVAQGAGLIWVNSDAQRVAQVRAAIEAEPRPVHVPRERPPLPVQDDGPLVLVETRKDLAGVILPYESEAAPRR
ncbi:MAG: ribonuclease E/G, partial [Xenophilus sp.]